MTAQQVNSTPSLIRPPVPPLEVEIKENALSRHIRKFNNTELSQAGLGVYISTNEAGLAATRKSMKMIPLIAQGCHFGFSGWHNFDIMVARKSSRGIICDCNPENGYFLHHILKKVRNCENRIDFAKLATQYVREVYRDNVLSRGGDLTHSIAFMPNISEDPIYAEICQIEEEIQVELKKEGSWLQTDEGFEHIRKLARDDKIVVITEDIRNTATFQKIAKTLQDNSILIDSLYLSNVHFHMNSEKDKELFLETAKILSENETIVIAADQQFMTLTQKTCQTKTTPHMREWFFSPEN